MNMVDFVQLLAAFVISIAATMLLIPPIRGIAHARDWVDRPDGERKLHSRPIASVGGIAIAAGSSIGLIYLIAVQNLVSFDLELPRAGFLIGAALVFGMGLLDDLKGLNFKQKFVVQLAAAYCLLLAGFRFDVASLPFVHLEPDIALLVSTPISLLWIVGIINATNLIDGLDGLAAGLSAIAFAALALAYGIGGQIAVVALALPLIGSLTGFLYHNFNPASIFMGNSGSYFLGFALAGYSLQQPVDGDPVIAILALLVILGLPVLDTICAMLRRVLQGRSPFHPDRGHVHHHLMERFEHRDSVLILYGVAFLLGGAGIWMVSSSSMAAMAIFGIIMSFAITVMVGLAFSTRHTWTRRVTTENHTQADRTNRPDDSRDARPWKKMSREIKVLEGQP